MNKVAEEREVKTYNKEYETKIGRQKDLFLVQNIIRPNEWCTSFFFGPRGE